MCILVETEIYWLSLSSDLNLHFSTYSVQGYLDGEMYLRFTTLKKPENNYCAELINGWLWMPVLIVFQIIHLHKQRRELRHLWENKYYNI